MENYDGHYEIEEALAASPKIIPAPVLYNFDMERLYAAAMDRLAKPLPSGKPSPFSSQAPGSAHSILMETHVYLQELMAHEINLVPESVWINVFRMMGVEVRPANYPVINLIFNRTQLATQSDIRVEIPPGIVVRSDRDTESSAITIEPAIIQGPGVESVRVQARLNRPGLIDNVRIGEYRILAGSLAYIASVSNDGSIVSPGSNQETYSEVMLRAREGIRTGNRGRVYVDGGFAPDGRCITARDFAYYAKEKGAQQVNVITRGFSGGLSNGIGVIVYPAAVVDPVRAALVEMSLDEQQLDVRAAEIIPLTGTIALKVRPDISDSQARELCAIAISQEVNPPFGKWGDPNFERTLSSALERIDGIYAVPLLDLRNSETGTPMSSLLPERDQLFEIQASIVFDVNRT